MPMPCSLLLSFFLILYVIYKLVIFGGFGTILHCFPEELVK